MIIPPPPPFIQRFQYTDCRQVNQAGGRVYITPDGTQVPSVTTILSATKDATALIEWRKRVGEEAAAQITKESSGRGTAMHNNLERYIAGIERKPGNNLVHVQANRMADVIISNGLSKVSEIWAVEQSLYYPGLYSGTTDLIGVHDGSPAVCDYKQTNKPKKIEWIEDYFIQLVFYGTAHNEVYGTNLRKGVVFMCSKDLEYQEFIIEGAKWDIYEGKMWDRVEQYYRARN